MTPTSLRIARTLLLMAAGLAAIPPFAIMWLSQEPFSVIHYMLLFFISAAAFALAATDLARRPGRAKPLAVAAAFMFAALGTLTGFSLGMITFPGAGIGVLGAWSALLHPPRRPVVIAFIIYMAIGLAVLMTRPAVGVIFAIPTILLWPVWVFFISNLSILPVYVAMAISAVLGVYALTRPRTLEAPPSAARMPLTLGIAIITGALAALAFIAWAYERTDTSARFELTPLVLGLVAIGGALFGGGVVLVRPPASFAGAAALGLGATLLLMTFTYGPAVTCSPNGQSQRLPLEWALTQVGREGGTGSSGSSGSVGPTGPGSAPTTSTGEFNYGDRRATYRCEGATVVEYREVR